MQFKQWSDFNNSVLTASQKWLDINTDMMVSLYQQQLDMVSICLDNGRQQVETLTQVKRVPDLWTEQYRLASDFNKKTLNNFRVTFDILTDSKKQVTTWAESHFKSLTDINPLLKPVKL